MKKELIAIAYKNAIDQLFLIKERIIKAEYNSDIQFLNNNFDNRPFSCELQDLSYKYSKLIKDIDFIIKEFKNTNNDILNEYL